MFSVACRLERSSSSAFLAAALMSSWMYSCSSILPPMAVGRKFLGLDMAVAKPSAPAPSLSVNEAGTCGACKPTPPAPEIGLPPASVITPALPYIC